MGSERYGGRRLLAVAASVALMVACTPSETPQQQVAAPRDIAADEQAVLEAHRALIQAYQEGSIDGFTWLLSSSRDLVIFHPRYKARYDGKQEAKEGLLTMFGRMKDVTWTEVHTALNVRGDVAWLTSDVLIEAPAMGDPFLGRGTEVWVREDVGWRLVHGHWSPTPGAMETGGSS